MLCFSLEFLLEEENNYKDSPCPHAVVGSLELCWCITSSIYPEWAVNPRDGQPVATGQSQLAITFLFLVLVWTQS